MRVVRCSRWMRDQGVAVAALVEQRAGRARAALRRSLSVTIRASGGQHGGQARPSARARARRASRYGGSRKTRSYARPRRAALREEAQGVGAAHLARSTPSASRLRADGPQRGRRRASTNVASRGAARERLDAQRARAGEQVEHARAVERRRGCENSASRTRSAVGRVARARAAPRSRRPPKLPGDDPHAADRLDARAPKRVERLGRAARARALASSGSAREQRRRARAGALEQPASSGSRATRNSRRARTGACRARSPSPRSSRSISASRSRRGAAASACRRGELRRARTAGRRDACSPRPTRPRSWCSCEMP